MASTHEDEDTLKRIAEKTEQAYNEGYIEGYKTSLSLFSELFEERDSKNELKTKTAISDILEKVLEIQKKKDFSNMYTLDIPEDSIKELKAFQKEYIALLDKKFKEGFKDGQLVLVKLYLHVTKKIHLRRDSWIREVREKLSELMNHI